MKNTTTSSKLIWLHHDAPVKPEVGQPCNGCGVCCAAEPCPVALFFLWQRVGSCQALVWDDGQKMYRCGMSTQPARYLVWLPLRWQSWFARRVRRWISAGVACDSSATIE
ncbi:hypothetical protein ACO0KY_17075 [Undibacterium sp. Dicai25W]|uniref:hypothetical protein n=1 Tax=Undibacterium sp. Dicai25W TaxID=3413034 RepID=UPI003BF3A42A